MAVRKNGNEEFKGRPEMSLYHIAYIWSLWCTEARLYSPIIWVLLMSFYADPDRTTAKHHSNIRCRDKRTHRSVAALKTTHLLGPTLVSTPCPSRPSRCCRRFRGNLSKEKGTMYSTASTECRTRLNPVAI